MTIRLMIRVRMVAMKMLINMIIRCEERSRGGPSISMGTISKAWRFNQPASQQVFQGLWCYRRSFVGFIHLGSFNYG